MHEVDLFSSIQAEWIRRSSELLGPGTLMLENPSAELERLGGLVNEALVSGACEVLDPLLADWAAKCQAEQQGEPGRLVKIITSLFSRAVDASQARLEPGEALALVQALAGVFGYAAVQAATLEAQARVDSASQKFSDTRQVLEKLDRSKSDFIAVSAHELKTPLTLIDGYASMLKENLEQTGINAYQDVLISGILHGTLRLQNIINAMIDASLIDNELLNVNFQPVWINQLISILKAEFEADIHERRQTLEIIPFEGMTQMTYGDPERLLQVFRNMLTNAIKFTPDGGKITIHGRRLPGFIEVTVADTGIGIDPEYLSLIFEKFVRLGTSALHSSGKTKYKGGGPGLGLHIARGIIESHGGTIWVESAGFDELTCPGSTFHVLIPIRTGPPDVKMNKLFAPFINQSQDKEKI